MEPQNGNRANNLSYKVSITVAVFISICLQWYFKQQDRSEVLTWLKKNHLEEFHHVFKEIGVVTLDSVLRLSINDVLHNLEKENISIAVNDVNKLLAAVEQLRKEFQFHCWLRKNALSYMKNTFDTLNIATLNDAINKMESLKQSNSFFHAQIPLIMLENDKKNINDYPFDTSYLFVYDVFYNALTLFRLLVLGVAILLPVIYVGFALLIRQLIQFVSNAFSSTFSGFFSQRWNWRLAFIQPAEPRNQNNHADSYFRNFFKNYFDEKSSFITWMTDEDVVGIENVLKITFRRANGKPYDATLFSSFKCEVLIEGSSLEVNVVFCEEKDSALAYFTPIKAGNYSISIIADGKCLANCPILKEFKAGKIDAGRSSLVVPSSLLVLEEKLSEIISFDERDKYGNQCFSLVEELYKYQFHIFELGKPTERLTPQLIFVDEPNAKLHQARITLNKAGIYSATILYDEKVLSDNVTMLVLTSVEMKEVQKNIQTPCWNLYYEGYISSIKENKELQSQVDDLKKRRKVYCYISPKILTLKEYYMKIFPKKLYSFRIQPSVKISLLDDIESAFLVKTKNMVVKLYSKHRNVLVATFEKLKLKNIGGSQTFEEKQKFFYSSIEKMHPHSSSLTVSLEVNRESLLLDTFRSVKSFSPNDWWRKFQISFKGENGIDCGGLTRELMQLLFSELFNKKGALFRKFNENDSQGLIHPSPFREKAYQNLKLYEFAGLLVGKCLVDCSVGQARQLFIKARFTRSFLSLILGNGVHWKHFASDDKQYYTGKIKYILENNPDNLEIYFTEDVYDNGNNLIKTVDLVTNGSQIQVTDSNKVSYLQRLAEFRLQESVSAEIDSFLKGFNSIIPDGLLSMFDENELELLLCGMEYISVSDWKANCSILFDSDPNDKVLLWFWSILSSFSQEELSRLLQFTTGCGQLPPEGFKALSPPFQITRVGSIDSLPTAHTCFNNLCLPVYTSREEMKKKLMIAINEGSEGFGLV